MAGALVNLIQCSLHHGLAIRGARCEGRQKGMRNRNEKREGDTARAARTRILRLRMVRRTPFCAICGAWQLRAARLPSRRIPDRRLGVSV